MKINQEFENYVSSNPNVKTLIQWYDLYPGHHVTLNKNFQKKLFLTAVKKAGGFSALGRKLGMNRKSVSYCYKGLRNISVRNLLKIAKYTGYPLKELNKKIIAIGKGSNLKPNFPFNLHNENGAEIRAAFLSDGYVDKDPTRPLQYCAYEKELHERLIKICQNVFGDFNTKTCWGNKTLITKFPGVLGEALVLSGVPRGNKMKYNPYLPKDILLGSKKIQIAYLRRVFDDEGYVCFCLERRNKMRRMIKIARCTDVSNLNIKPTASEIWVRGISLPNDISHNLLTGERLLLFKLGIEAKPYFGGIYRSKKGNITAKWELKLVQQDQLIKFGNLINFTVLVKKEKLRKILGSYPYRKLRVGEGKEQALAVMKKFYKEKDYFTFGDIGREIVKTGRSFDLASRYIKYFCEEGIIEKIKYGTYKFKQTDKN